MSQSPTVTDKDVAVSVEKPPTCQMILDEMPDDDLATPASRISYLLERGFTGTYRIPGTYSSVRLLPPSASWFRPSLDVLRNRDELEALRLRWPKEVDKAESAAKKFTEIDRKATRENYMLHWIIAIGEFKTADEMIAAGSVVMKRDYMDGCNSPIAVALMWGHEEYAKSLLERGIVHPPSPCLKDPRENSLGKMHRRYLKISFEMIETLLKSVQKPAPPGVQGNEWTVRNPRIYQMVLQREDIPFEQRKAMVKRLRTVYKLPFSRPRKVIYHDEDEEEDDEEEDEEEEDEEEDMWYGYDSDGTYGDYPYPPEMVEDEIDSDWYTEALSLPQDQMFWVWKWGWQFDFWHNARKKNHVCEEEKRDDSWTICQTIIALGARSPELVETALVWMRSHGFRWPTSNWSWMASREVPASTKLSVLDNLLHSNGWAGKIKPAEIRKQQAFGKEWKHPSKGVRKMDGLNMLLDHAVSSGSLHLAQSIWKMGWRHLAEPTTMYMFRSTSSPDGGPSQPTEIAARVELLKWLLDDSICGKQIAELLLDRSALADFTAPFTGDRDGQHTEENTSAMACWKVISNWPPAAQRIARDEAFDEAASKLWGSVIAEKAASAQKGSLALEIKQEKEHLALKLDQLESCHIQYRAAVEKRHARHPTQLRKKVLEEIDHHHELLKKELTKSCRLSIEIKKDMYPIQRSYSSW